MAVKFELPFTQNSHVVAIVCVLAVAIFLSPYGGLEKFDKSEMVTSLLRLAHLSCFASWLGVQVWVTFFAGVTMFRHLPRRTFGFIQSKLFPKYFMLGTVLSAVTTSTYIMEHPFTSWGFQEKLQGYSLCVSLVMVLLNLLYFQPQTSKVSFSKNEMEKEVKAGEEEGKVEEDKLAELNKNPKYAALKKRFILLHSFSSVANLVSLSGQCLHLWHLAGHLTTL